jgi:PHD/YefM family antitoxin component YafN of YafNO toxin-antitoxin module
MIQVSLTNEQLLSLIHQLPKKDKEKLIDELTLEKWLETPGALDLKKERERQFKEGKTVTSKELREKIKNRGY